MLTTLKNAFAKGDIEALTSKLLHSSCWQQHNAKHFGEDQLRSIAQKWLSMAGRREVVASQVIKQEINQDWQMAINLTFAGTNSPSTIDYTFWLETNGKVIKSANAMVDTYALAKVTGLDEDSLIQMLPTPDAMVIADYDQQDHLQSDLATPSRIANLDANLASSLDAWWSIWAKSQLAAINDIYDDSATIQLPGSDAKVDTHGLFDFVLAKFNRLTRAFAQLEQVLVDGEQVAVKWYLDGDEQGQRLRVPMITMLNIAQGKIYQEHTATDVLAFQKRFPKSSLFSG